MVHPLILVDWCHEWVGWATNFFQAAREEIGAKASWKPLLTWRKRSLIRHLVLGSGPVHRLPETGLELVLIHLALSVTLPKLGQFLA